MMARYHLRCKNSLLLFKCKFFCWDKEIKKLFFSLNSRFYIMKKLFKYLLFSKNELYGQLGPWCHLAAAFWREFNANFFKFQVFELVFFKEKVFKYLLLSKNVLYGQLGLWCHPAAAFWREFNAQCFNFFFNSWAAFNCL